MEDIFEAVRQAAQRSRFVQPESSGPKLDGLTSARQRAMRDFASRKYGSRAEAVAAGAAPKDRGSPVAGASAGPQQLAQRMAASRGWSGGEWNALKDLVQRESGWKPTAANPTSSAYGLFQFLDSTRANYGLAKNASVEQQIDAGLRYISDRYKTPSGALNHWLARKPINGRDVGNWY